MNTTNTFERTDAGNKLVNEAMTKVIIYFLDGNTRTFHSRDRLRTGGMPDKQVGINRLKKMVYGWKSKVKNAMIYDLHTGEELFKYKDGSWA